MGEGGRWVKWFSELSNKDISIAGGKGASLAEMYNNKFPVPPGFIVTAQAYDYFIEKSGIRNNIMKILNEIDIQDTKALDAGALKVRDLVTTANMPEDMKQEITEAYEVLDVTKQKFTGATGGALSILKNSHEPPFVAVRSSATTEDLVDASFAGQQDSYLNIKGNDQLIHAVKKCFASLFNARAIYYRKKKGFFHEQSFLSVVVQKMIDSQKSGVMFSKNPIKNDGTIMIEAVYGLGEGIVSGMISPDHYILSSDLEIIERKISDKKIALTRSSSGKTEQITLTPEVSNRETLNGHELRVLGHYAQQLEEHYGKPQDIEYAIDQDGIFIVQSRPITTKAVTQTSEIEGNVLLTGLPASPGVASGVVRIIHSLDELSKISKGNVMVTTMTNPDMVVAMEKAVAIITDEGGITSHAAIVSREMGTPAVVGTRNATKMLKDGQIVTVDGFTGRVLDGKAVEKKVVIRPIVQTKRIKIKTIVDLPDYAMRAASCGAKAVGLVRLEALIATSGKHPVYFIKKGKLKEYIEMLYTGLRKISQPFEEIWVRTSDVRSDEYKNLEGAPEQHEMNPMLGDHGIRFSLKNQDLLEAEFAAIKELADEYGHKTFGVMFPQVISAEEVREAKKIASRIKFPANVKIGIMIETPAAVQCINELCEEGIQFISFGTNDLTQYTLAIDRNNEDVQSLFTEMHPAVLNSIAYVIRRCKKYGVESSICGQAGSKPEMARFLVKEGIDSISVNADAAYEVSKLIAELENQQMSHPEKTTSVNIRESSAVSKQGTVTRGQVMSRDDHSSHAVAMRARPIAMPLTQASESNQSIPQAPSDEILKQIEHWGNEHDEYNPGMSKKQDIPSLNDAIPVSSLDFAPRHVKTPVFEMRVNEIPSTGEVYEFQQEAVFAAVVAEEVNQYMTERLAAAQQMGAGATAQSTE